MCVQHNADALAFKLTIHCFISSLYSHIQSTICPVSCSGAVADYVLWRKLYKSSVNPSLRPPTLCQESSNQFSPSFSLLIRTLKPSRVIPKAGLLTCYISRIFYMLLTSGICTGIEVHELRTWRREPRYQCLFLLLILTGVFHNRFTVRNVQYCL